MKERDDSLDYLKGIACILMVLAHYQYSAAQISEMPRIVSLAILIGGTAPVIFFAVTGVTATFQSRKNIKSIVVFYIAFALLGLSYNIQWRPDLYNDLASDVPQIIAMSVIIIAAIEKYARPNKVLYLIFAIAIFCLHYLITRDIYSFPFKVFLFAPGLFPLIPWLSMFFLGIFAYRSTNIINFIAGLTTTIIFLSFILLQFKEHANFLDKLNMSIGYFTASASIIFFAFYFVRIGSKYFNHSIIRYFGTNSLLFLYVHILVIQLIKKIADLNILISLICVLLFTYLSMIVLQLVNKYIEKLFYSLSSWILIILLICLLPVVVSNLRICLSIEMILGMLFSSNYQHLSVLIHQKVILAKRVSNVITN